MHKKHATTSIKGFLFCVYMHPINFDVTKMAGPIYALGSNNKLQCKLQKNKPIFIPQMQEW